MTLGNILALAACSAMTVIGVFLAVQAGRWIGYRERVEEERLRRDIR
ncbi:MAG: hypothetical protein IJS32_10000 [Kiritimatiellae bacterium]|nr:hypothetical protein [Kiritimatiellia bacterium]